MAKIVLALLFSVLFISDCFAAAAFVNYSEGSEDSGSAQTSLATAALSTTTGNAIIVTISESAAGDDVSSVTDTALNTYVHATGCYQASDNSYGNSDVWYALNITGNASNVVTAHFGGAGVQYPRAGQVQVSGLASSSPFETCAVNHATGTSVTSASFSPAASGNINIVAMGQGGGGTSTAGASYTLLGSVNVTEYQTNAAAGAQTASYTYSSSTALNISVATFKSPTSHTNSIQNGTLNNATIN